ncbi:AsnC family transcriptional regulator, partial [Cutibacterium granulosum DSM 20700]
DNFLWERHSVVVGRCDAVMGKKLQLDEIDREIVLQLRKDGRMSNADLARHVSLSAPACLRRVKHLEDSG